MPNRAAEPRCRRCDGSPTAGWPRATCASVLVRKSLVIARSAHRSGGPGFVHADGAALTIPDFVDSHYFNTVGSFLIPPRTGLLFINFDHGDLLHLSGEVEIVWDGAERLWRVRLTHGSRSAARWRCAGSFATKCRAPSAPAPGALPAERRFRQDDRCEVGGAGLRFNPIPRILPVRSEVGGQDRPGNLPTPY
jgi:hypothetical protein